MRKGQIDYKPIVRAVETKLTILFGTQAEWDLQQYALDEWRGSEQTLAGRSIEGLLAAVGIEPGSKKYHRIRKSFRLGKERGHAGVFHVDEVCCDVLGKHPSELYGEEWFAA